jgi:hypothetical protein
MAIDECGNANERWRADIWEGQKGGKSAITFRGFLLEGVSSVEAFTYALSQHFLDLGKIQDPPSTIMSQNDD